jgi:hypothetical protein
MSMSGPGVGGPHGPYFQVGWLLNLLIAWVDFECSRNASTFTGSVQTTYSRRVIGLSLELMTH